MKQRLVRDTRCGGGGGCDVPRCCPAGMVSNRCRCAPAGCAAAAARRLAPGTLAAAAVLHDVPRRALRHAACCLRRGWQFLAARCPWRQQDRGSRCCAPGAGAGMPPRPAAPLSP